MSDFHSISGTGDVFNAQVLDALERLVHSQDLKISDRNRRFLDFVVKQTVEGKARAIKAYSIGVDVFGREETFDPSVDPVVRIEASRLRAALAAYYAGPGAGEAIRITISPGTYVPTFSWAACSERSDGFGAHAAMSPEPAIVLVISPRYSGGEAGRGCCADALVDSLALECRKASIRVLVAPAEPRSAAASSIHDVFAHPDGALSADISVRVIDSETRFSWRLGDLETGEVLASGFRDCSGNALLSLVQIDEMARMIVRQTRQAMRLAPPAIEAGHLQQLQPKSL